MRRAEAEAEHEHAVTEFQQQVDADRAAQQPAQPVDQLAPQPEAQPQAQTNGLSPRVQAALNDPEIRTAIQTEIQHASTAQQAYSAAVGQLQRAAAASLLSVPELANVRSDQELALVIQTVARTNPQRANEIVGAIQTARRNVAVVNQHVQVQQNQQREQMRSWADAQDRAFDSYASTQPKAEVEAAAKNLPDLLEREYGINKQELAQLYGSSILRSVAAQRMLLDLSRYHAAKEAIHRAPMPSRRVMRPGDVDTRGATYEPQLTEAAAAFKSDPNPRNAARQLSALRRARANQR
jgi:hypothetical protein